MVELEIDGRKVSVPDGSTVMDAANRLGIHIPHFCYHKKLSIAANCRMCLVQVEKAPKPLPACATPVTGGMKVSTHSPAAVSAQKGVMEFLLINHPLDCPICDQGGECQLQDLAVGYGGSASRFQEEKRVVVNKNLGPLISTDMTRCIHCTRCVRFGQEIAGIMELGMANRGEHSEILTFVGRSVDSELSGNAIDLCPVGALTSKPFRYTARTWELSRRKSVSPHCGLGSNLIVQMKQNRVMRVLPRENEDINECWLSDKDRFSYEGLNSEERLTRPMVKRDGQWQECDWPEALEFVANELKRVKDTSGPDQIGALAAPHQTLEELYLLQKLVRGLGTGNVDHRLRQSDFSPDRELQGAPWLGTRVAAIPDLKSVLVVGSTLRKDHPLLALRLRQAVSKGCQLSLVNPVDDDLLTRIANRAIVAPSAMASILAQILKALAEIKGVQVSAVLQQQIASVPADDAARNIAKSLAEAQPAAVFLGNLAQHHPQYGTLHALGQEIARLAEASFGFLGEAANSVGGYLAGAVPVPVNASAKAGMSARQMIESPRKAYILLGVEPELDCYDGAQALNAMYQADFVVALSSYRHRAADYADVLLPIAPFTETSGTFVSTEGRVQSFNGVVKPLGDARPGWKVLRVLGNLLGVPGFDYESSEGVRAQMVSGEGADTSSWLNNRLRTFVVSLSPAGSGIERIGEVPIYQADAIARRSPSLQKTRDGQPPVAWMRGALIERLGLKDGDRVRLAQNGGETTLHAGCDDRLPDNCIRVAAAHPLTAALGALFGTVSAERAMSQQRMAG
ncbi:MAG: NADH-quinone oxidoreductase subunit G [Betaproteobacteria bacterium]|nr:NADH-quinone oxidoreductase subunit G [Betaproteobacteria bacterium]